MTKTQILIAEEVLKRIHAHGAESYPEEGAGLMLGRDEDGKREVLEILTLTNSREDAARHNRYLITAQDMLAGEQEAMRLGLDIVGVFHSHPDHPNRPSEFDREWALPWYSYLITSVQGGEAAGSRSWRLAEDRQRFDEEEIILIELKEEV
jgi:proteasome lid subunit RPN8/RPN11